LPLLKFQPSYIQRYCLSINVAERYNW